MAAYIRCPECQFCIGAYAEFIDKARQAIFNDAIYNKNSPYANFDPEKMVFNPSITPSSEPLFEAIKLKNRCCRMHAVTPVKFDKMFK